MAKSKLLKTRFAVAFGALLFCSSMQVAVSGQAGDPNSLKSYLSCKFDDGLKIVDTARHRQGTSPDKFRTVKVDGVEEKVSVVDGYRVMVVYPKTHFFANIKAEQSNPPDYAKDKEILIKQLQWFTATSKELEAEPTKVTYPGLEGYGLNKRVISGNTLGIYVLFSDANQQVLTVYFLNQPPEKRKFQTIEEYRTLRDRFLAKYTSCIQSNISRQ